MKKQNNPKNITVQELWNQISSMLSKSIRDLKKYSHLTKRYTSFIIDRLAELDLNKGYHVDKEYWPRVDVSFFNRETENNWMEWSREIAIEHENDAGTWDEELDKLFAINAGIKVLIAYSDDTDEELFEYLTSTEPGSFQSIYKSRKYHTENDRYLFVFGPVIGSKKRKCFSAFSFAGKKVKQLKNTVDIDFE